MGWIQSHALRPLRIGICEPSGGHESGKEEQLRLYTAANQPFVHRQAHTGIQERIRPGRRAAKSSSKYEPKTARGKVAKLKRDAEKKPVRITECVCSFSGGIPVRIVVEKKRVRLSKEDKLRLLLERLSGSYTT